MRCGPQLVGHIPPQRKGEQVKNPRQKALDYKPPWIIEEIIAKYVVDGNQFRLGSTNPKKKT